jgi:deoxyadenosine/deoxycytidine kinase
VNERGTKQNNRESQPLIAVVGPCASGKTTLVENLKRRGYHVREVNQEHSYVPAMWQRFTQPDLLIYLDVSQEAASERRRAEAEAGWWEAMEQRLEHARAHADLLIETDDLNENEVLESVLSFLERRAP